MTLAEVLQAASNAAAQNVSGPVDLLTMLLQKGGVPVPSNAVGSTQWMREKGLYRDVNDTASRVTGETLGIIGPLVAAAKAPQIARGLLAAQENAAAPGAVNRGMAGAQRGIFGGELAKTADKAALAKAKQMADAGADQRAIWSETGWFKGGDGKWRFEIDDSAAKLNQSALYEDPSLLDHVSQKLYGSKMRELSKVEQADLVATHGMPKRGYGTASTIIPHNDLFAAYPDVGKEYTNVTLRDALPYNGSYGKGIEMNAANEKDLTGGLLHELQHAIQQREGFARGGSPDAIRLSDIAPKSLIDDIKRSHEFRLQLAQGRREDDLLEGMIGSYMNMFGNAAQARHDAYRRLAGEAEARAVQSRMNLTPAQRRALFPLDSYDVPVDQLIYR